MRTALMRLRSTEAKNATAAGKRLKLALSVVGSRRIYENAGCGIFIGCVQTRLGAYFGIIRTWLLFRCRRVFRHGRRRQGHSLVEDGSAGRRRGAAAGPVVALGAEERGRRRRRGRSRGRRRRRCRRRGCGQRSRGAREGRRRRRRRVGRGG